MKLRCPACPNTLSRFSLRGKDFYACTEHGFLANGASLRTFFKDQRLADFCLSRIKAPAEEFKASERLCPQCAKGFRTFVTKTFSFVRIDVCQRCQVFWFDQGEWDQVKGANYEASIPPEAAENLKATASAPRERDWLEVEDASLLDIFMISEESELRTARSPIATYMFVGFALVATLMARSQPGLFEKWAFLPEQPFANLSLRFLRSG